MEADEHGYKTKRISLAQFFLIQPYDRQLCKKIKSKKQSLREKWNEKFINYNLK